MNPVLSAIADRRSNRAYKQALLSDETLNALLQAAVQAPSAVNRQPWHFTVVRDQKLLKELNAAVWEAMMARDPEKRSARFQDPNFDVFYGAPCVIFISGDRQNSWTPIDCGIAVENIALAAQALGLGSVILGMPRDAFKGPKGDDFRKALAFPDGFDFEIAIAVGEATDTKEAHPVKENKISFVG